MDVVESLGYAGEPIGIVPDTGAASPLVIAMAWLTGGTLRGFVIYWFTVWLLGGLGMVVLARDLAAPRIAAAAIALGYLFSGLYTGHGEHTCWLHGFSALPWIIWHLDVAICQRRWGAAIEAGGIWGGAALAGYPGVVTAQGLLVGFWALGRTILPSDNVSPPRRTRSMPVATAMPASKVAAVCRTVAMLMLFVVVGVTIMSPLYLGFSVETRGYSERSDYLDRQTVTTSNALHPRAALTLSSPYLCLLMLVNPDWCYTDISSFSIYVGGLTVWLAGTGAGVRAENLGDGGWRRCIVLGLSIAMSQTLPVRGWLYDWLPPTRFFRHASLFRFYSVFGLGCLAAVGAADLARIQRLGVTMAPARVVGSAFLVAAMGFLAYSLEVNAVTQQYLHFRPLADLHVVGVWLGVALVGALTALALLHQKFRWPALAAIVLLASGNALLTSKLNRPIYCCDSVLAAWARVEANRCRDLQMGRSGSLERHVQSTDEGQHGSDRHILTKEPVLLGYPANLRNLQFPMWMQTPALAKAITQQRRIYFSPTTIVTDRGGEAFDAFYRRAVQLGVPPMVVHPSEGRSEPGGEITLGAMAQQPAAQPVDVDLIEYSPTVFAFRTQCAGNGWLLVTDPSAYPNLSVNSLLALFPLFPITTFYFAGPGKTTLPAHRLRIAISLSRESLQRLQVDRFREAHDTDERSNSCITLPDRLLKV